MSKMQLEVGYFKGSLPVYANAGTLDFDDAGVTYREKVSGNAWAWPWPSVRVWFDPPGPSGRFGAFMALGVLGLLMPTRRQRQILITAPDVEATFELTDRRTKPVVLARRIIDAVPAAAGRVSLGDEL